ncbi:MAG: hypothetical protein AAGF68_01795 [Pseudomonadota bacterium]
MQATPNRRLTRTLGNLALACLNATLILVVLALFLSLRLVGAVERVTETFISAAEVQVAQIAPLNEELSAVRAGLTELQAELGALRPADGGQLSNALEAVSDSVSQTEAQLVSLNANLTSLAEAVSTDPGALIDRAVASAAAEAGQLVANVRGCRLPENG